MVGRTVLAFALVLGLATAAGAATPNRPESLSALARDVDRAESVRAVKDLQRTYAQYLQFGLWREAAAMYAENATAQYAEGAPVRGRAAIARALLANSGHEGLNPGQINTRLIEEPLVNLEPDGEHAKGRWYGFFLLADGKGAASIQGGVYENDYVRQGGRWKIAALRFHPQYDGPYETGWTNWKNQPIGFVPYHFTADETGKPDLGAGGPPKPTKATPRQLAARIQALVDEQKVRNLQDAYGYYVDRRMWDDVGDLFSSRDGALESSGLGVYQGKAGVARGLERMGPKGLTHGILNDHVFFDMVVSVSPGGHEAFARGVSLGMIGDADKGTARWEVTLFRNRFVKESGLWKMREIRTFPHFRSDYAIGWGKDRQVQPTPTGAAGPDKIEPRPTALEQEHVIPAFLGPNPATGLPVAAPEGYHFAGGTPLTGPADAAPIAAAPKTDAAWYAEQRRKLAMATAWDGAENVNTAYGESIDDFQWPLMGAIFGTKGAKEVPFAGYYIGGERITNAVVAEYGPPPM